MCSSEDGINMRVVYKSHDARQKLKEVSNEDVTSSYIQHKAEKMSDILNSHPLEAILVKIWKL